MPEGRLEFAKTPVGSNSFDRGYSANSQWSNEFDPTGTFANSNLSPIQAGFLQRRVMTEINCFWGLQFDFKPLSIYTVVVLYDPTQKTP